MRVIGNVAGKDVVGRARWDKAERMQDLVNHRELPVTGRLAGAGVRVQTRNPGQDSAEVESHHVPWKHWWPGSATAGERA